MRSWEQWVRWTTRRYGLSPCDAEDIVQDTVLYLLEAYRRCHPDASEEDLQNYLDKLPAGLMCLALHCRVLNLWRSRQRKQQALEKWALLHIELKDSITEAFTLLEESLLYQQLPPPAREIYKMLDAGFNWREIPQKLGISQNAAKMRFQRGIEAVRKAWNISCDDISICGVIDSGNNRLSHIKTNKEVGGNETAEERGASSKCITDRQSVGATKHSRRSRRTKPAGGGRMNSHNYGCSSKVLPNRVVQHKQKAIGNDQLVALQAKLGSPALSRTSRSLHPNSIVATLSYMPMIATSECLDCSAKDTFDANSYCKKVYGRDCSGWWPFNEYTFHWKYKVYRCPEGYFYECKGPEQTNDCCATSNTADQPCEVPAHPPNDPSQDLESCAQRGGI